MTQVTRGLFAAAAIGVALALGAPAMAQHDLGGAKQRAFERFGTDTMHMFTQHDRAAIVAYFGAPAVTAYAAVPMGPTAYATVAIPPYAPAPRYRMAYAIGQPLPVGVATYPMPATLAARLPAGDFHYYADGDRIVVVDAYTRTVVDVLPRY